MKMADFDALVPNPLMSDRQFARFYHLDLSDLEDIELTDELNYLRPLLWGLPADHWLRERVRMIEDETIRRRGDTSFRSSGQRKPKPAAGVKL